MKRPIVGLHHVTATVDQAQPDLDFCAGALGLRLVKQTVNFDNHHVYHFYYGNERGAPGTIWTTFPYHGRGVPTGTKGAGQVAATSLSVPAESLDWWRERLGARGVAVSASDARFGEAAIVASDPSGLAIELVGTGRDDRRPWEGAGVPAAAAVRGLHSVSMTVRSRAATVDFLTRVLGLQILDQFGARTRLGIEGDGAGHLLDVIEAPDAPAAVNGLGTVHHVALAVTDDDEQMRLREMLVELGFAVTEIRDRQYFKSIYFREPGGVLLELATLAPGFDVDEPLPALGRALKLPPWEEPHRGEIEAASPGSGCRPALEAERPGQAGNVVSPL
jgi:glyoxalase family protein